jgi:hypothetical protein
MGFIPQVSTKTLYAYLTQKGREYILNGDKEDFQVAYFTFGGTTARARLDYFGSRRCP